MSVEFCIAVNEPSAVALDELAEFFAGWAWQPSERARHALLANSTVVVTARDLATPSTVSTTRSRLVGLATALTDGAFFGYLSFLEVLAEYQGRGIGRQLVEAIANELGHLYDIAAITDAETVPFYEKVSFRQISGVHLRRHPQSD